MTAKTKIRDLTHSPPRCRAELPQTQNKEFYPALDGLRACAVLMVFIQHYILSNLRSQWQWGWAGVDVFFVLSGFLITGILFDTRDASHRFRSFYIRRTLRIFPLYYGVFLVILLLTPLMRWGWNLTWAYWPFYAENYIRFIHFHRFVSSGSTLEALSSPVPFLRRPVQLYLGHFWSLGVEEQFYLGWPLVVFAAKERIRLRNICLAVVIAMPFVRFVLSLFLSDTVKSLEFFYRVTPLRIDALLMGGLLALVIRGPEIQLLRRIAPWLSIVCISLLFSMPKIITPKLLHHSISAGPCSPWMETFGFTAIDILSACAIWISLQGGSFLFRALSATPLRKLGQISYGFYVFHDIPHTLYISFSIWLVGQSNMGAYVLPVVVAFVSTLVLSLLSFHFFEMPFLRLKERFAPS